MKKIFLFFAALSIINYVSAQSYFGYCIAHLGHKTYVSEVVDVTTLPNKYVQTETPNGEIKLLEYYDMIIKQWFTIILNNNGHDAKKCDIYSQLKAGVQDSILNFDVIGSQVIEEYTYNCKTGYEPSCLCQNKKAAI